MTETTLGSMFLLGLLGTGHCVGMCGPLVLAVPSKAGTLQAHGAYHAGRILTYVTVGAVLGALGAGLTGVADAVAGERLGSVARLQIVFSLVAAAFLLLFGLVKLGVARNPRWLNVSPTWLPGFRRAQKGALLERKVSGIFFFGLLMGFLPCGLSYAAFARALAAPGPLQSGALVLAFALGTVPGLLLVGTSASRFARKHYKLFDLLSGLLMIAMALSLGADVVQALSG